MLSISSVVAFDTTSVEDVEASDSEEEPPSGSYIDTDDVKTASYNDYSLSAQDISLYYRNGTKYQVTLTHGDVPVENASVTFKICGVNYSRTTNSNGSASISINLAPGNYEINSFYGDYINLSGGVNVLSNLNGDDIVKIYRNDTQYYTKLLDNNGNSLANGTVTFNINGVFYNRKSNDEGIAKLNINLMSGEYIIIAVHENGLSRSNLITVLPSINGSDIIKFYRNATRYEASFLNSDNSPLTNTNVSFNINGVFYVRTTDNNGIARLNINLLPGNYIITAYNPITSEYSANLIGVLTTMFSSNVISEEENTCFDIVLYNNDGSLAKNTNVSVMIDGTEYIVTTDENGQACLELTLDDGIYNVVSTDLATGLKVYNNITVNVERVLYYSCYGVSPDGRTIMAIGRPSASNELSNYGYTYYMTIFDRTCPYCGSNDLYWGIFWAGDETSNWGVFPATNRKEGGSAEGHIFCANCDCDWSIFGNNHGSGKALKAISKSVLSSKDAAYLLKNGQMIYS